MTTSTNVKYLNYASSDQQFQKQLHVLQQLFISSVTQSFRLLVTWLNSVSLDAIFQK